jgi:hypothetical protein
MSENPTGYRESPDTTDGPVAEDQIADQDAGAPADEDATTLTTDDDAQKDDGVVRPGNEPD